MENEVATRHIKTREPVLGSIIQLLELTNTTTYLPTFPSQNSVHHEHFRFVVVLFSNGSRSFVLWHGWGLIQRYPTSLSGLFEWRLVYTQNLFSGVWRHSRVSLLPRPGPCNSWALLFIRGYELIYTLLSSIYVKSGLFCLHDILILFFFLFLEECYLPFLT